jgi:hypothetical protein
MASFQPENWNVQPLADFEELTVKKLCYLELRRNYCL